MRVSIGLIRKAGSWEYLREATPHVIVILKNIKENETILFKGIIH